MNKKLEILEKVHTLFMRYGIKSVTMDDISRHLGVSKKTLYQYVENKADLINQTIENQICNEKIMINSLCESSVDPIEEMLNIARHVSLILRELNPSVVFDLQKYYNDSWQLLRSLQEEHISGVIEKNIQKGIDLGLYRDNLHPEIIAKMYVGNSTLIVDVDRFPIREYKTEKVYLEFINYHIHGIASRKGLKLLEKHLQKNIQA
ncbi:MAG: TetR/AcrR family transcriptional regulator [Saprospiraceae bacterium]